MCTCRHAGSLKSLRNQAGDVIILGDPGAVSGDGEKSKTGEKKFGRRKVKNEEALLLVLDFSSPEFFFARFRLFPVPTNCPWVSEDGDVIGSISSRFVSPRSLPHTTAGSLVYPLYFLTNHSQPCSNRAGFPVIGQFCHLSIQHGGGGVVFCKVCVGALPYREI